jgi:hypothetical protein
MKPEDQITAYLIFVVDLHSVRYVGAARRAKPQRPPMTYISKNPSRTITRCALVAGLHLNIRW